MIARISFLVLVMAPAPTLACAQGLPGITWTKSPSIVIVGTAGDPRVKLVRDAVDFWNDVLAKLGSGFRLGAVSTTTDSIPGVELIDLSNRVLARGARSEVPASVRAIPGDLVVALSDANFVSFDARWPREQRALVAIKSHRVSPLTLPNVLRNVIAHEFGHAIGLNHNADPAMLMCGRPANCRPDAFSAPVDRYFPLMEAEKEVLRRYYPADWRAR